LFLPFVSADVIIPTGWSLLNIKLISLIILIEFAIFFLLLKYYFKKEIVFYKVLLIVLIANLITSIIGAFIPIYHITLSFFLYAFLISVIIEFIIYLIILLGFMKMKEITKKELFIACLLTNIITYSLIYFLHNLGIAIR
jgi:hypothetical protein